MANEKHRGWPHDLGHPHEATVLTIHEPLDAAADAAAPTEPASVVDTFDPSLADADGMVAVEPPSAEGAVGSAPPTGTRRREPRLEAELRVDYRSEETFLYAYTSNVSSLGIFVRTNAPEPVGTRLELLFDAQDGGGSLRVHGEVAWVNPFRPGGGNTNPGMGIRFLDVDGPARERLVELVRRIAYLGGVDGGGLGQA